GIRDFHVTGVQTCALPICTLHIMSVVTGAQGKLADGKQVFGAVVDIDSIRAVQFSDFGAFASKLEPAVETLRVANKIKFFNYLRSEEHTSELQSRENLVCR